MSFLCNAAGRGYVQNNLIKELDRPGYVQNNLIKELDRPLGTVVHLHGLQGQCYIYIYSVWTVVH